MTTARIQLKPLNIPMPIALPDLRFVVLKEGSHLVAQCLQFDIAVQGRSMEQLSQRLEHTLAAQVLIDSHYGRRPFEGIEPAPKSYWQAWEKSQARLVPTAIDGAQSDSPAAQIAHQAVKNGQFAML
jgi:hypothetical protein